MGLPRIDEKAIRRPRLLARLDELPALTLVRGPIGSGKTTLAAQWASEARAAGHEVLWLDGTVDTPATVVEALAEVAGAVVPVGSSTEEALAGLTPRLRRLSSPLVLVIDAFDPLADELGEPLMSLLRRCRSIHAVMCVRGRHDFVWHAVAGAGYRLIAMDELAFTADELVTMASAQGIRADDQTVEEILQGTAGLAAFIRVGMQARRDETVGSWWSWGNVRDFIRDQVTAMVGADAVAAVSAVTQLGGIDIDVLRASLGPEHRQLVDAVQGLGVVERRRESDRLHLSVPPVVVEALRGTHHVDGDRYLASLQDSVIGELERLGRVMDAVDLARRAGRHEALVGLVKRHWWDIAAEDVAILAEALTEIPNELLEPRSALMRHLAELIPDRVADQQLEPIDTIPVDDDELRARAADPDATVLLDGIMIALMAARFRGERAAAREEVRRGMLMVAAMAHETQHDLPASIRRFFVQAGLMHLLDLDLTAAELAFRRGYGPDRHESPDVLRREAANKLALVSALRGDHTTTRAWLHRSDAIDPPTGWLTPNIEAPRRVAEAIMALDRLDRAEAERHMAELSATISTDELWFLELTVRAAAALLWDGGHVVLHEIQLARAERGHLMTEGTLAQAQLNAWEATLHMALGHGTRAETLLAEHGGAFRTRTVRARLLHLSGRSREALGLLASITQTPHDFTRVRAEALLLTAQVHHELGDAEVARTYLAGAAVHAELVSTFASVSRSVLDEHVEAVPALRAVLDEIDSREPVAGYPEALEVVVLTERERQLLELLPTPQSRDSIARSLFVSTNTIKTQLQALYRKLGVKTRDDVVARAYELGLLR
ncbi:LuxR C-terminal-related transcriptional regulator [Aeromicrobium fastidiosum]|uniref:HTH luxR-type domain-containing protein n=1 Tax=Aeromicrobium fastidiosum TaxID=52699 RepID=A0A641AS05_9ACTN|nr:LuxR C-terminal-related transcriptional regulator [Aeromicrobium fastidiosum]KAA1380307.1 hypothetical protein ESP62_003680 [Aeromicrobium fastidiosum]MBP2389862.1 LuxR family maltose regulon positive regulatory protein [Aeromicrobium fastidiosum]